MYAGEKMKKMRRRKGEENDNREKYGDARGGRKQGRENNR
jgi:hypothetical protein